MTKKIFQSVKIKTPKTNRINLSHPHLTTMDVGYLVPTLCMEVLPGDRFQIGSETYAKAQAFIAPVMDRADLETSYYFVPWRILWDGFEKAIVGDPNAEPFPFLQYGAGWTASQLKFANWLGLPKPPTGNTKLMPVSAGPFAAVQCVYDKWYRDQDLIPEVNYKLVGGNNGTNLGVLAQQRYRAYSKDAFTSARPFAQKGAAVSIPLGEITEDAELAVGMDATANGIVATTSAGATPDLNDYVSYELDRPTQSPTDPLRETIYARTKGLSVGGTLIEDLRIAVATQALLEKFARMGTRFKEYLRGVWGEKPLDSRLDWPEFITGVTSPVVISEVLNTADTYNPTEETGRPQADQAGHGIVVQNGKYGTFHAPEHGFLIALSSIKPQASYYQGVPKMWTRFDWLDYPLPEFAHLGEQEIKIQELYAWGLSDQNTFGYAPRYHEFKDLPARISGEMDGSLNFWHYGREFQGEPALTQEFIEVKPESMDRVFALQGSAAKDRFTVRILHKIVVDRKLPVFNQPQLLG